MRNERKANIQKRKNVNKKNCKHKKKMNSEAHKRNKRKKNEETVGGFHFISTTSLFCMHILKLRVCVCLSVCGGIRCIFPVGFSLEDLYPFKLKTNKAEKKKCSSFKCHQSPSPSFHHNRHRHQLYQLPFFFLFLFLSPFIPLQSVYLKYLFDVYVTKEKEIAKG